MRLGKLGTASLTSLPQGTDVFIDANIFIYTFDSLIVAAMDDYGLVSLASRDNDFDHLPGLTVYKPTDL